MSGTVDIGWRTPAGDSEHRASRLDIAGERAVAVGVGLLIVTGFASSYTTLRDLAVEVGGFTPWLAPVVPLSFDLGIVVLSLKVVLAARTGRDARVLRVLVLLLSVATVVANGAASSAAVGRLLHAVPPAMFVICFETLAGSARHEALARGTTTRLGRPPVEEAQPVLTAVRWLLAPRQTWSIWRARVLETGTRIPEVTAAGVMTVGANEQPARRRPSSAGRVEPAALPQTVDQPKGRSAFEARAPVRGTVMPHPRATADRPLTGRPSTAAVTGAVGHRDRLTVAVELLRGEPAMTAVALAEHLHDAGHPVSVRTAQRVRLQAQGHGGGASPTAAAQDGHPK